MVLVEVSFLAFGVVDTKLPVAQEVTKIAQAIKNITLFIAFFIVCEILKQEVVIVFQVFGHLQLTLLLVIIRLMIPDKTN